MVYLGRGLGTLAAFLCFSSCVKRQQPVVEPQASVEAPVELAPAPIVDKPRRVDPSPAVVTPMRERNATCISGSIKTADRLEIPVARARVSIVRGDVVIGDALSDDKGRFSWCTPKPFEGTSVRTSLRVEKSAFMRSERELDVTVGSTAEVNIGLHAAD